MMLRICLCGACQNTGAPHASDCPYPEYATNDHAIDVWAICQRAKVHGTGVLSPWELSVYRLNIRPDGTRYSVNEAVRQLQYAEDINRQQTFNRR